MKYKFKIKLSTLDDILEFCNQCEICGSDVLIRSIDKKFEIDGCSIMGIISLNANSFIIHTNSHMIYDFCIEKGWLV